MYSVLDDFMDCFVFGLFLIIGLLAVNVFYCRYFDMGCFLWIIGLIVIIFVVN